MALPGFYKVNFTDPRKEGFIIEPYQTNGTVSPVSDALDANATRASTSLLLYGRDVPNYGERIAENFVQLLENFAGPAAPNNPIEGQLWFDTGTIYVVSSWINNTTLAFQGEHLEVFTAWASAATPIQLTTRPLNNKDNSLVQTTLLIDTVTVAGGVTTAVFKSTNGDAIAIPQSAVGGFIASAAPGYARLRVATTVGNAIKWIDVTNVLSATDAPEATHLTVGDLWYDETSEQLSIYDGITWKSVAAKYLPLTGGTMTGTINMGSNKIFSEGVITAEIGDLYALVNRIYVDGVQVLLQEQIDDLDARVEVIVGEELEKKVNRAGDQMTGALVFGTNPVTSPLTGPGIDAAGTPIIRPLITWNPTDYTVAAFQPNHVVDKNYVALAFAQHLIDEKHGEGGFIQIQDDGTGRFPNSVAFAAETAGQSYGFSWFDVTGTNIHKIYAQYSGPSSQLVFEAGTDENDTLDFRHTLQGTEANPLFRVGFQYNRSYKSLFLHDGQPQPTFGGNPTDINDDTAAASKGFVRQYVADNIPDTPGGDGSTVISVTFSYNLEDRTYSQLLIQSAGDPIVTNMYHQHDPYDIPYSMNTAGDHEWSLDDMIPEVAPSVFPDYPFMNVGDAIQLLNVFKANVHGAVFMGVPKSGVEVAILSYNSTDRTITIVGDHTEVLSASGEIRGTAYIDSMDPDNPNIGLYTIVDAVADEDSNGDPITIVTVAETFTKTGAETEEATFMAGEVTPPEVPNGLVTRSTLDVAVEEASSVAYDYFKITSSGTNDVRTLPFTYKPGSNRLWLFRNGQKLRSGTMTGGDFNETSENTITIANVYLNDEFEVYKL